MKQTAEQIIKAKKKAYLHAYYLKHKDKLSAQHKEYYKKNKEHIIETQKQQYAKKKKKNGGLIYAKAKRF